MENHSRDLKKKHIHTHVLQLLRVVSWYFVRSPGRSIVYSTRIGGHFTISLEINCGQHFSKGPIDSTWTEICECDWNALQRQTVIVIPTMTSTIIVIWYSQNQREQSIASSSKGHSIDGHSISNGGDSMNTDSATCNYHVNILLWATVHAIQKFQIERH